MTKISDIIEKMVLGRRKAMAVAKTTRPKQLPKGFKPLRRFPKPRPKILRAYPPVRSLPTVSALRKAKIKAKLKKKLIKPRPLIKPFKPKKIFKPRLVGAITFPRRKRRTPFG